MPPDYHREALIATGVGLLRIYPSSELLCSTLKGEETMSSNEVTWKDKLKAYT